MSSPRKRHCVEITRDSINNANDVYRKSRFPNPLFNNMSQKETNVQPSQTVTTLSTRINYTETMMSPMSLNQSASPPTHSTIKGIYCFHPYRQHHQQRDIVWISFERVLKNVNDEYRRSRIQKPLFYTFRGKRPSSNLLKSLHYNLH